MADPATATHSSAVSPSSEPSSRALSPTAGGTQRLLFTHDLVSGKHRGAMRFGLVRMIYGEEDFEDSDSETGGDGGKRGGGVGGEGAAGNSDNESGAPGTRSWPLSRGFVRVQWYPEGTKQDVRETKLKLEDRSIVPRDFVRHLNLNNKQCGIVTNITTECAVKLVGTNCVLYPVNSKDLQHVWQFMYGDYIVYDFWLGKVYDLSIQIIVQLSNGARCSMSEEDGAKLYDIYPHVSDVGLFFDDAYGFYPGQVLIGPSKAFTNVQWLYGVKPVLSKKSKFRVVVEEVQVVELKVTWITKSYSPKGPDSVFPPPSTITQENLCRVKRLGFFDHTQRQLGERALYVFPTKSETTRITCEGPEGAPAQPDDPVVRKLKRMFRKESGKKMSENSDTETNNSHSTEKVESMEGEEKSMQEKDCPDDVPCYPNNGPVSCPEGVDEGEKPQSDASQKPCAHLGELESDEEIADDTDDTSSVTSSASSTASQHCGPSRKKSIPLSIRNLKKKHKKKRTKFSREFKPGDRVAVEVVSTVTTADVLWKDGRLETGIRSNDLIPIQHLDNHEFCPGDYVVDKRPQTVQDSGVCGVIQSGDHKARTCVVKWVKLNAAGDDVEVNGVEEDVSVYDISDHPDFHFRITDIVIRIGNSNTEDCENERSVGQVCRVDLSSKVEVVWADESKTVVLPQHLYNVESEIEETYYDSAEGSSSGASSEEWEDESDSWETDNGPVEEEPGGGDNAVVSSPTKGPPADGKTNGVNTSTTESAGAIFTSELAIGGVPASEEKPFKETPPRGFRELKEALKILESLKNMTVEQLWTGSPTSPTAEPSAAMAATSPADAKPTKEKRFLDDIKKLQENLKKTLDNVAIVEEEKMEAAIKEERSSAAVAPEPQTPVRSEWPSDTPVLCQHSGGKPGVTFTSAKGEVFSVLEWSPETHSFQKMEFQPADAKKFFSTVRKEMALLATSLPDGIMVKTFEGRMDLFSAVIKGPNRTPYEDGLFLFDIQLPNIYPAVPPLFRYLSQCSGRLNPNLYDNGKVCVSLLGTWIGKGTERWTSKSSLLQVLISIQGLILVNEPYYNEAGFDSDRGLQEGYENSRCYNEMALIKMVQSMTQLLLHPADVFEQEIREHFACNGWRLVHRLESWLELHGGVNDRVSQCCGGSLRAEPLEEIPSALAHSSPDKEEVRSQEDLEDSGLSPSTLGLSGASGKDGQQEQNSECDSSEVGGMRSETAEGSEGLFASQQSGKLCQESQPAVRPKKRRKSYRSFLPERSGYPDIGFPLFPLSKGFVKSMRSVLQQYRATMTAAGIPEHHENK
ncbi:LOW QUALITY PROTEIN: (E3-independent) E2 ubiquitin-conjugating enzyme UBE2O [Triplophysa dalaica]|uniref:LOW QUALITY PROTEIN: (E3-independent) E2 ubiquitin-conjugating enzyme UBE2O n=1 Tax=Triplophysa dalaica TaxID=1582913 RepID=UPI0024DF581E|nr:LOW QUALITY PROTEIN: (E3-independent) E2 ubiquitin-conjugating enzyme UBE2O [Triplophysa dalaica]